MWTIIAMLAGVLAVSVAAPAHAEICLFNGSVDAQNACMARENQYYEDRRRERAQEERDRQREWEHRELMKRLEQDSQRGYQCRRDNYGMTCTPQ